MKKKLSQYKFMAKDHTDSFMCTQNIQKLAFVASFFYLFFFCLAYTAAITGCEYAFSASPIAQSNWHEKHLYVDYTAAVLQPTWKKVNRRKVYIIYCTERAELKQKSTEKKVKSYEIETKCFYP